MKAEDELRVSHAVREALGHLEVDEPDEAAVYLESVLHLLPGADGVAPERKGRA